FPNREGRGNRGGIASPIAGFLNSGNRNPRMPAETSIALSPARRRDLGEHRLPLPRRLPWLSRRPLRITYITLLLRIALAAEVIGTIAGVWWFAGHGIGWVEFVVFAFMFMVTALGITVGYHRMFAHRSLRARPWVRLVLGIWGAMGMQGP